MSNVTLERDKESFTIIYDYRDVEFYVLFFWVFLFNLFYFFDLKI